MMFLTSRGKHLATHPMRVHMCSMAMHNILKTWVLLTTVSQVHLEAVMMMTAMMTMTNPHTTIVVEAEVLVAHLEEAMTVTVIEVMGEDPRVAEV